MTPLDKALKDVDREEIIELSKKLIHIPSVTGDERRVIHLARGIIEELGIKTRLYGSEECPILTATINPEAKKLLVFNGHLDTVPIANRGDWDTDPYDPQLIGDTLTGRGSCDMKAACAVMIHVAGIIKDLDFPPRSSPAPRP